MVKSFYQIPMRKDCRNLLWVIGKGGLLGSSLLSRLNFHQSEFNLWSLCRPFTWNEPDILKKQIREQIQFFQIKALNFESWVIIWAAGAGVIGSSDSALEMETQYFRFFINELQKSFSEKLNRGRFFLASSAGGVWGGAQTFPITEETPTCPISEYGKQKLKQEETLIKLALAYPQFQVLIGRISNLYGPGQKLSKPQGLLSQLCRSVLLRSPLNIFVPLDTVRDYIFAEDCAELILRALKNIPLALPDKNLILKIFASEDPVSISTLLHQLRRLTHRDPIITQPNHSLTVQQPKELFFKSQVLLDSYTCKPLIEGSKQLLDYQESLLQAGDLPYPEAI